MNQCLLKLCQVGCYVFISYSFSSAQWLFFKCSSDKIKRYSYINISHAIICAKSQSTRLISSNCRLFYACLWAMFWQFFFHILITRLSSLLLFVMSKSLSTYKKRRHDSMTYIYIQAQNPWTKKVKAF